MTTDHIGGRAMAYSFEQFCKDANAALRADPGRGGKETIRRNLEVLLKNAEFVDSVCGPQAEYGTRQIYRDPDFDFVVLAHVNKTARKSPPHDHGSSWAVYGQASLYTEMHEYRRGDGKPGDGAARTRPGKPDRLTPGTAEIGRDAWRGNGGT